MLVIHFSLVLNVIGAQMQVTADIYFTETFIMISIIWPIMLYDIFLVEKLCPDSKYINCNTCITLITRIMIFAILYKNVLVGI